VDDGHRIEHDFLGEVVLPPGALYGVHTARALENFPISGRTFGSEPALVRAFAVIKQACAIANEALGVLSRDRAEAIAAAADEVQRGLHHHQFVVDLLEGAGGTSLNMNANEVLANRGLMLLRRCAGEYAVLHPNDHVNLSQSTNDVLPSAIHIACHEMLGGLVTAMSRLADAFGSKREEFAGHLRLGRTCLQDAQPMTLGQTFGAWEELARRLAGALRERQREALVLPLGGTAIGTGFGAAPGYRQEAIGALRDCTQIDWVPATDLFDAMSNADFFGRLSGELRTTAGSLAKIAQDLILLSSGPEGGIAELVLPPVQAGSSIMPGKVNPVIPMAVCQVAFRVTGHDAAVAAASQQGQLEINPYEPVIAAGLLASLRELDAIVRLFGVRCVAGIAARPERMAATLERSAAVATALIPALGYDAVAALVRAAQAQDRPLASLVVEQGLLDKGEIRDLLRRSATPE
jgi:aspartate ammonia-lyase